MPWKECHVMDGLVREKVSPERHSAVSGVPEEWPAGLERRRLWRTNGG